MYGTVENELFLFPFEGGNRMIRHLGFSVEVACVYFRRKEVAVKPLLNGTWMERNPVFGGELF